MKRSFAIMITLLLLVTNVTFITSCDKTPEEMYETTLTGEVMHVFEHPAPDRLSLDTLPYRVYVEPIGLTDNSEWILFTINSSTEMESEFSFNLEDMPEIAVGSKVEITFNYRPIYKPGSHGASYFAKSVKPAAVDSTETSINSNLELVFHKDHKSYYNDGVISLDGTVVYVAKANFSEGGYIVYVDSVRTSFSSRFDRFWFSKEVAEEEGLVELLESGQVGYKANVFGLDTYPFYNRDIMLGQGIGLIDK